MPVIDITKDPDARTLTITAHFAAPVERVWRIYEDPRQLEQVWGPPQYPATFVAHELRPGTRTTYYMASPRGGAVRRILGDHRGGAHHTLHLPGWLRARRPHPERRAPGLRQRVHLRVRRPGNASGLHEHLPPPPRPSRPSWTWAWRRVPGRRSTRSMVSSTRIPSKAGRPASVHHPTVHEGGRDRHRPQVCRVLRGLPTRASERVGVDGAPRRRASRPPSSPARRCSRRALPRRSAPAPDATPRGRPSSGAPHRRSPTRGRAGSPARPSPERGAAPRRRPSRGRRRAARCDRPTSAPRRPGHPERARAGRSRRPRAAPAAGYPPSERNLGVFHGPGLTSDLEGIQRRAHRAVADRMDGGAEPDLAGPGHQCHELVEPVVGSAAGVFQPLGLQVGGAAPGGERVETAVTDDLQRPHRHQWVSRHHGVTGPQPEVATSSRWSA